MGAEANVPQFVVSMIFVADVQRSVEFYKILGFEVANTYEPEGKLCWAWMEKGKARIMLSLTGRPPNPGAQDVMFYFYVPRVAEYRDGLIARKLKVGELRYPFYSPKGEFRIDDPDGFTLMVAETDDLKV